VITVNYIISILVGILSGISAYYISHKMEKGPVHGSAVVTFVSGIIFTLLENYGISGALDFAVVAATSGYAGMVGNNYVKNLKQMVFVSIIASTLLMISSTMFSGVGGRLGVIAAVSCFAFIGLKRVSNYKLCLPLKKQLLKSEDSLY